MEARLVTAFVSTVVAGLTVAVVAVGAFLRGPMDVESWENFFYLAGAGCVVAGLLGFVVGPEKMADHFGFLWGTAEPTKIQVAVSVAVILIICTIALFGWPK